MDHYIELNKKMWNDRVQTHLGSEMYAMDQFLAGKSSLNSIELELMGDLNGLKVLHLQCHFGQDSLSMARMGARVTGVDFSEKAIQAARDLNHQLGLNAEFICSDVLELDHQLKGEFDLVFSSYGTITWLPELTKWGRLVNYFLKPGGRFILVEFHPNVWMFDEHFRYLQYGYFNSGPIIEEQEGTYADRKADLNHTSVGWNHALEEVLTALLDQKLMLTHFGEYDFSPYKIFSDPVMAEQGYQIKGLEGKLPLVYSLVMKKNS